MAQRNNERKLASDGESQLVAEKSDNCVQARANNEKQTIMT